MKKIILFSLFLFFTPNVFANTNCELLEDEFEKYECRSEKLCKEYDENKKVFNIEKFKKAENYKNASLSNILVTSGSQEKIIQKAVEVYKENMNSIYKCAIIWAQKNSLNKLKKLPTNENVRKSIESKINDILQKLDTTARTNNCLNIDKNTVLNKLSILRQTTYLTCDYSFYMEYLKTYYKNPANALGVDAEESEIWWEEKSVPITQAANILTSIQNNIEKEVAQAYKVFPIAYHAYSEYENNFPIHFLMELLKEDFYIFREKLHEVLNPINQVVYKISNAMKE